MNNIKYHEIICNSNNKKRDYNNLLFEIFELYSIEERVFNLYL